MGKSTGVCGGRGGSQHLQWKNFYSNGVQGGTIPIATGMALAEKFKQTDAITIAFLGDGTLGEGAIYEAFNMASLWSVPILYVLENNRIAQTTPVEYAVAGSIAGRFEAFGIAAKEMDTSDVREIQPVAGELIEMVREKRVPQALILNTYRFGPHSKGDDTRDPALVEQLKREHDPIKIHARWLEAEKRERIEVEVEKEIRVAFEAAEADPFPEKLSG
jgi:TPP-dependent pyruvate/acetoin dehydrogenase alpha subunit